MAKLACETLRERVARAKEAAEAEARRDPDGSWLDRAEAFGLVLEWIDEK